MAACLEPYIRKEDPNDVLTLASVIAEGSFGTVYKGSFNPTGDTLAIKIIQLEEGETFSDLVIEIDVLSKCHCPNIVQYFGSWRRGDELFIAMELCDGGSASDLYQDLKESFSEAMIAYITRETLKGLDYLHNMGIIHRDIKGANILLTLKGAVKLVDFGVSGKLSPSQPGRYTFIGTPYWMAPEVIENKNSAVPYDTKADIWSIGITMLEFAHGQPPLSDIHPMKAIFQIPIRKPPTLTNPGAWSSSFPDILEKCLARDPKARLSCAQLLQHQFFKQSLDQEGAAATVARYMEIKTQEEETSLHLPDQDDLPASSPSPTPIQPQPMAQSLPAAVLPKSEPSSPQLTQTQPVAAQPALLPASMPISRPVPTSSRNNRPKTIHATLEKRTREVKNRINRKFIKQQIQEIKKLQKQHQRERENMEARHNKAKQAMNIDFNERQQRQKKSVAHDDDAAQRKNQLDKDNDGRKCRDEMENNRKQQQTVYSSWLKDMQSIQRLQKGEFSVACTNKEKEMKEAEKLRAKEEEKQAKQEKRKLSKNILKTCALEHNALVLQMRAEQELLFNHQLQMHNKFDSHHLQLLQHEQIISQLLAQQSSRQSADMQMGIQTHARQRKQQKTEFKLNKQWMQSVHTCERECMSEMHGLTMDQLQKRHAVETEQLKRQQLFESKEFKKENQAEMKKMKLDFEAQMKQQKPSKSEKQDRKAAFAQVLANKQAAFDTSEKSRIEREDREFYEIQELNRKRLEEELQQESQNLVTKQAEVLEKLEQDHKKEKEALIVQQFNQRLNLLNEQHEEQVKLYLQLREELRSFENNCFVTEKQMQQEHNKAVNALLAQHHAVQIQFLQTKHQLEQQHLRKEKKKQADMEGLQRVQATQMEQLKGKHMHLTHLRAQQQVCEESVLAEVHERRTQEDADATQSGLLEIQRTQTEAIQAMQGEVNQQLAKHVYHKTLDSL
eukprot:TRINITY_DN4815_c0_g1_i1.p1 TRINITY_DN4815_c0_g1~~TRINITY_DN4815_c0_g1_i1.p1  ORF type:complete len:954 (-),score=341.97 TRINITY_DN4815_c0_g1_i1:62-2923(-)